MKSVEDPAVSASQSGIAGSLHGVKWLDEDGNGERNASEPGLPGVVVYLDLNSNGVLDEGEPIAELL